MGILPWGLAGLLLPAGLTSLPAAWPALGLGLAFALLARGSPIRWPMTAFALALAWSIHDYRSALDSRLPLSRAGQSHVLTGTITDLPRPLGEGTSFLLQTADLPGPGGRAALVDVRWYRNAERVAPGETWRLAVRLAPPRGRVNFAGADPERHEFVQGIAAIATVNGPVRRIASARGMAGLRGEVLNRLQALLADRPGHGLVLALAVAARTHLEESDRALLQRTGTAHLLAVSGLHVGLVAGFSWLLLRWPLSLLGARLGWQRPGLTALWLGLAIAAVYAGLAGFGVATRRALLMLAVPIVLATMRRPVSAWAAYLAAATVVLALEPRSALSAGFWLSFAAVGALLVTFVPRNPTTGRGTTLLQAQWTMSWMMLPLGLAWFGLAAPLGFAANLLAIPWVSAFTLPLTLLGMAMAFVAPGAAESLLDMAARSGAWLLRGLAWIPTAGEGAAIPRPGLPAVLAAMAGALLLTLPRGMRWRWFGLGLALPLFLRQGEPPPENGLRLELLDVGQGLAALVQTHDGALLYDAGPGIPEQWSRVDELILPALAELGIAAPDRIVVSHGDLDHAGGLATLRRRFPDVPVHANLGRAQRPWERCDERLGWTWGDVDFQVLHPGPWLPYLGNDSSCVLLVSTPSASFLLPGDIGHRVERRLSGLATRGHAVVVTAHHASRSSSSPEFLSWSRPDVGLVSSGWGNRFGFPHPEVVTRFQAMGAPTWSTADCGAIRVNLDADGNLDARSARRSRPAPWRYPPARDCP